MSPNQIFKSAWQAACPALSKIMMGTNSSPYGICISPFLKRFVAAATQFPEMNIVKS
jgi:hypothetical protein